MFLLSVQALGAVSAMIVGGLIATGTSAWACLPFVLLAIVPLVGVPAASLAHRLRLRRSNSSLTSRLEDRSHELERTRDAVILGLARFAEFRDGLTGQHLERIGAFVEILGKTLQEMHGNRHTVITDAWIHDIRIASALHDIGKVGIPDQILLKDGKLTHEERLLIEDHPIIGGECLSSMAESLSDSQLISLARDIAFSHHERWDGTGYPFKLQADSIPLAARIVSVADVYDALTTARTYKGAMPHGEALSIIVEGSGTQFDPEVVDALKACHEEFRRVAVQLRRSDLEHYDDLQVSDLEMNMT